MFLTSQVAVTATENEAVSVSATFRLGKPTISHTAPPRFSTKDKTQKMDDTSFQTYRKEIRLAGHVHDVFLAVSLNG